MLEPFLTYLSLCGSAFAAGVVNSLAGGGTLLTFPSLVAALGAEQLANITRANVTSTVALVPGSLAGAWGFRRELGDNARWLRLLVPPSLLGGLVGALLLTRLPARYFALVVPWLLLVASLLFLAQPHLARFVRTEEIAEPPAGLRALVVFFQFLVAVYGGYFGAGIGILMLSSLGLMGIGDVHRMNAVKTILASCINGISVLVFVVDTEVAWAFGLVMAVAAIAGGYCGAHGATAAARRGTMVCDPHRPDAVCLLLPRAVFRLLKGNLFMSRIAWPLLAFLLVLGCADGDSADKAKGKDGRARPAAVADAPPFKPLDDKNAKTTKTGLKIEDVKVGDGAEATAGALVEVHYTGWLTDGKQFDSSHERARPLTLIVGAGRVIKGWDEGIVGMKEGGRRRLQIPPELAYGKRGFAPDIPPDATLVFAIDLLKVKPGVKIEEIKEGSGPAAKPGDQIQVHYTGKLLSGKQFDSSIPRGQPFPLRLGAGQVIPGWDAGLVGLKVGGKRKLTIPPDMAYGDEGRGDIIPPNSTLVFEIELLKIEG